MSKDLLVFGVDATEVVGLEDVGVIPRFPLVVPIDNLVVVAGRLVGVYTDWVIIDGPCDNLFVVVVVVVVVNGFAIVFACRVGGADDVTYIEEVIDVIVGAGRCAAGGGRCGVVMPPRPNFVVEAVEVGLVT